MRNIAATFAGLNLFLTSVALAAAPETPVGTDASFTVVLPAGTHVSAQTARAEVLVEVASTRPAVGGTETALCFSPLTAGVHDLRGRLLTADNLPLSGVGPLNVRGVSTLTGTWNGSLTRVPASPMSRYGGYRAIATIVIAVWIMLLLPIVLVRRWRKRPAVVMESNAAPLQKSSLSDLVLARAMLSPRESHRLEMLLLRQWSERCCISDRPMGVVLEHLRAAPETAYILTQLQIYLHAPSERSDLVQIDHLLAPYATEVTG